MKERSTIFLSTNLRKVVNGFNYFGPTGPNLQSVGHFFICFAPWEIAVWTNLKHTHVHEAKGWMCIESNRWNLFPWSLHSDCLWILLRKGDFYMKYSIKYETFSFFFNAEVVRTRLREEGTKYRSFFQTLSLLMQEEGYSSFYRGLATHLIRQIPNTAIMMTTYELVVYLLNRQQHYYLTIGKWKTKSLQWTINILNDRQQLYIYISSRYITRISTICRYGQSGRMLIGSHSYFCWLVIWYLLQVVLKDCI